MKVIDNIITSYSHLPYTWKHKMAIVKLEKRLTGKNSIRIILHDCDKLFTYTFLPFLTLHQNKELHRKLNAHHHFKDIAKLSEATRKEIVLDWESAHYTKEDKPETAKQYCSRVHPDMFPYLSKYFDDWNLN